MLLAYYILIVTALLTMVTGFYMIIRLRRITRGGTVGRVVNIIFLLILIFTAGYLVALYMPRLSMDVNLILVAFIYLFGAAFVVLVLWLIQNMIQKVMKELEPERHG